MSKKDALDFLDSEESGDVLSFLDKPKRKGLEKTLRAGAQYGLGLLDRVTAPLSIFSEPLRSKGAQAGEFRKGIFEDIERLAEQKATGIWDEKDEELFQELQNQIKDPSLAEPFVRTADISASGLAESGLKKMGYDISPEGGMEHVSRILGSFTPKELIRGAKNIPKIFPKKNPEKFASGLTKPKFVDSKTAKMAVINADKQARNIQGLNREAAELAKKSIGKHLPVSKKIEEGFDFDRHFNQKFGNLKLAAEKYNPEINLTPITNFMNKTAKEYSGIPSLHPDAKKIMSEIRAFTDRPRDQLKHLYRIFRSNNKKQKSIYERAALKGSQKEYSDFLKDFNNSISQSIEKTLPKDSAWMKEFKELNREYSQKIKADRVISELSSVLRGTPTLKSLEKLAFDKASQKKLSLRMGQEGAAEISQISKDLHTARNALSKMSVKERSRWANLLLIGLIVPGTHGVGTAAGVYHGIQEGRRGLGWLLSRPSIRKDYRSALKAISSGDKEGYISAATRIKKELDNQEE